MPRSYGPIGRTALQVAFAQRWASQESFAAFVSAELREQVSRAQVANWASGRDHCPADVVVLLAKHCADQRRAILQVLADELDLLVVERPTGLPDGEAPLVLAAHGAGAVGRLVEAVASEVAPHSPGGPARTAGELLERLDLIADAETQIARLRTETEASIARAPKLARAAG